MAAGRKFQLSFENTAGIDLQDGAAAVFCPDFHNVIHTFLTGSLHLGHRAGWKPHCSRCQRQSQSAGSESYSFLFHSFASVSLSAAR